MWEGLVIWLHVKLVLFFFFFLIGKLAIFCDVLMGMDGKERIIGGHVAHFRLKIHKS